MLHIFIPLIYLTLIDYLYITVSLLFYLATVLISSLDISAYLYTSLVQHDIIAVEFHCVLFVRNRRNLR